jgi:Fe2+ or Zn2+ uptake regulation protein
MNQRSTRQLAATYEVLAASTDHPTAEQMLDRVRRVIPRVSLGTVYRNLDKLRNQGRLRTVWLGGGVAHYDAVLEPHDHFVCEACGSVLDLSTSRGGAARGRPRDALRRRGYVVRWQTTAVYGVCPACAAARHAGQRQLEA